jgi:hypothetical protein
MPEPTRCGCPGPNNTISRQGMCPTCGVEGPDHQRVLREHLAAGNPRPMLDRARAEGRQRGYALGLKVGRLEAVEALAEREASFREPEYDELEAAG